MTGFDTITRKVLLRIPFALIVGCMPAHAVALKDYAASKNSETFRHHLSGITAGYQAANDELNLRRVKKLYCPPANSPLQFENYREILEKEVQENAAYYTPDSAVESALLFGLMKTYPCRT